MGTAPERGVLSGVYLMIVRDRIYFFSDATVNIDPDAETLAAIAINAADVARQFDVEPRVAMLSFSNFGSTRHPQVDKVQRATELVKEQQPGLQIDGEMQADVAVVPDLMRRHYPFSAIEDANVLIFPELASANTDLQAAAPLGRRRGHWSDPGGDGQADPCVGDRRRGCRHCQRRHSGSGGCPIPGRRGQEWELRREFLPQPTPTPDSYMFQL